MNRRLKNHAALAALTAICLGVAAASGPATAVADQLSIVSAYLCLFLLGVALLIGPFHAIRKGKPLAHSYIRRDIGVWAALTGLLHFYLANVLSMNYEYLGVYVENASAPPSAAMRSNLYSWGTILGYVIAVLFVVLLTVSNDWMARIIGLKWWKRIQRVSYLGFILTCIHAFAFQILESREALWVCIVLLVTVLVFVGQSFGIAAIKKWRMGRFKQPVHTDG
jgi:DMSO/TMAO reductase YedYZ heme-binding membrane subunit